jgi:malate dehydrogenase (oxaloacetate-decarboxylating)(NADP+)
MHADAALVETIRNRLLPESRLRGEANLLIMPTIEAASIAFNLAAVIGNATPIGPFLIGVAKPVHIVTESITVRGLVNMSALAVVDAQSRAAAS